MRILIYTSIFSFYLSEFYLNSVNHKNKVLEIKKKIYLKKENKKFDERDKFTIYLDEKKLNNKISVASSPSNFLYENNKIFPLSGLSYSKTIDCNENGYYSTFLSDRYGFNNEDNDWSKKTINFLLIGDSNAMGSCVNPEQNIIGNLKKKTSENFLNLGYAGNGPMINLATLIEYGSILDFENILLIYTEGNDNRDLGREVLNQVLNNYLNSETYSQKLIKNNSIKDKLVKANIEKNFNLRKTEKKTSILDFLKLTNVRGLIHNIKLSNTEEEILYKEHENVFKKFKKIADNKNAKIIIIYMPTYDRYVLNNELYKKKFRLINKISKENNFNLIDLSKPFENFKDPTSLYPFKMKGHLSPYGYKVASEVIYNELKKMKLIKE